MSKKLMLALMVLMLTVLTACNGGTGGNSANGENGEDTVKIGMVLPLTGPAALYGEQTRSGAELAAEMINEEGGILDGKEIELVFEDDEASPEKGVSAVEKLMQVEKVDAIGGGVNSSVSMATVNVANEKILNFVTVSKAPDIMAERDPYRFRLNSTNNMDGELFHKFMAEEIQPETVAVIVENTDYGVAEVEALKANWGGEESPEIVGVEYFELTETDFTNPLTKLKSLNADALYVVGAAIEINSAIFRQAHETGFNDTIKLLAPGNINTKVVELAGEGSEGIISADLYQNSIDNELNRKFVSAFEEKFGNPPEKMEVLGFETIWFIAKAMDKAESATDYDKISEVLSSNEWESPRGTVVFEDGQALGDVLPLEIENGEIQPYE